MEAPRRRAGRFARVLPHNLLRDGINLEHAGAAEDAETGSREARRALVVEDQQITGTGQAFFDQVRVVLSAQLVHWARHLLLQHPRRSRVVRLSEVGAEAPYDLPALPVDDRDEVGLARVDQQIVWVEAQIAVVEPAIFPERRQVV